MSMERELASRRNAGTRDTVTETPSRNKISRRAQLTNEAAWQIINTEKKRREALTAKLKTQRETAAASASEPVDEAKPAGKSRFKRRSD